MNFEINAKFSLEELNYLFEVSDWRIIPNEALGNIIKTSSGWITIRDHEKKLIGFVHYISDRYRFAHILRLLVHPNYRGQGLGGRLMLILMEELTNKGLEPSLVANVGKEDFFKKFGFESKSKGYTAMCKK